MFSTCEESFVGLLLSCNNNAVLYFKTFVMCQTKVFPQLQAYKVKISEGLLTPRNTPLVPMCVTGRGITGSECFNARA